MGRHHEMHHQSPDVAGAVSPVSPDSPANEINSVLPELASGTRAVIQNINGGYGIINRLCALGLVPGTSFQVIRNPGRGPLVLEANSTRIAISRGQAQKVNVAMCGEPQVEEESQV